MKLLKKLTLKVWEILPPELEIFIRRRRILKLDAELNALEDIQFRLCSGRRNTLGRGYLKEDLTSLRAAIKFHRTKLARLEHQRFEEATEISNLKN